MFLLSCSSTHSKQLYASVGILYIGIVISCITCLLQWIILAWNSISAIVTPVKVAVKSLCEAPLTNAAYGESSVNLNER